MLRFLPITSFSRNESEGGAGGGNRSSSSSSALKKFNESDGPTRETSIRAGTTVTTGAKTGEEESGNAGGESTMRGESESAAAGGGENAEEGTADKSAKAE